MKRPPLPLGLALAATGLHAADRFPAPREIRPVGKYPVIADDYFASVVGKPCDFNTDGDLCRVAGFGPGVRDVKVEGGALHFTAGAEDAYLYFGRWLHPEGDTDLPDENIGTGWRPRYEKVRLIMRVKQSRDESLWQVDTRCLHGGIGNVPGRVNPTPSQFRVKGRDWQEVSIPLHFDRGGCIRALSVTVLPTASVSGAEAEAEAAGEEDDPGGLPPLEAKGKGRDETLENQISIDTIKAANVTTPASDEFGPRLATERPQRTPVRAGHRRDRRGRQPRPRTVPEAIRLPPRTTGCHVCARLRPKSSSTGSRT